MNEKTYTWEAPLPIYAMEWSSRGGDPSLQYRVALGSFVEQYCNKIDIVRYVPEFRSFVRTASFDHAYPATKVNWIPDEVGTKEDLLATTGDFLRLWKVSPNPTSTPNNSSSNYTDDVVLPVHTFSQRPSSSTSSSTSHTYQQQQPSQQQQQYCSPLTSMDWNKEDVSLVATSSIDTTCTVWNVETQQTLNNFVAHDDEVYDIAFGSKDTFVTAGKDGSIRMFDLRALAHSTIAHESQLKRAMLRVVWNSQDRHFLAAVEEDAPYTTIIDIRQANRPVSKVLNHRKGHSAPVNAIAWAPQSSTHLCTCGDDSQALIWNLHSSSSRLGVGGEDDEEEEIMMNRDKEEEVEDLASFNQEPILAYTAGGEINNVKWSSSNPDWICIAFDKKAEFLRV